MSRHVVRARAGESRANLYDEITDKIITELEAGHVPWVQSWGTSSARAPLAKPKNASTARQYSGINVLILWGAVIEHGFTGQSWLTFRQALSLGGHVRKGERGTTVVYADRFIPNDEKKRAAESGEEALAILFLKRFTVQVGRIFVGHPLANRMHYYAFNQGAEGDASFDRLRIGLERGDQPSNLRTVSVTEFRVIEANDIFAATAQQPQALFNAFPLQVALIDPLEQLVRLPTAICDGI